jgi:hypothetical protein
MFLPPGKLHIPGRSEVVKDPHIELINASTRWTRQPAEFVADLSTMDLQHTLLVSDHRVCHGTYRNHFEHALLYGWHHVHPVITRYRYRFDCQDLAAYPQRIEAIKIVPWPVRRPPIPSIRHNENGYSVDFSRCSAKNVITIDDDVYFGTPIEPLNWGMWLLQALPNAYDFVRSGQHGKFLCYTERQWQMDLLRFMGIEQENIIPQEMLRTYDCNTVTMQQYTKVDLVPTDLDRGIFAEVALKCSGDINGSASERIFVSRRSITTKVYDGLYRALINEDELVEALAARGFLIVEPEFLSFADQVALFRRAKAVVGLGGAGMFNVIFCQPGTKIVSIESSAAFTDGHACLFAALGHKYGFIFGKQDMTDETPIHKRWTIDVAQTLRIIESFF